MGRVTVVGGVLAALVAWGSPAAADDAPPSAEPRRAEAGTPEAAGPATPGVSSQAAPATNEEPKPTWYGWQTLIVDGFALGATTMGVAMGLREGWPIFLVGTGGYLVGAPVVHFAHGRLIGLGSLGLRVVTPFVGALLVGVLVGSVSEIVAEEESTFKQRVKPFEYGVAAGFLAGMAGAIAIDAFLIAYEPPAKPKPSTPAARLVPSLSPRSAGLALQATF